ncbi:MAG: hypothetical protein QOG49_346 [Frankiaceae bacterium]|nr:hypothetical protein [Frankiaceae bacterium]
MDAMADRQDSDREVLTSLPRSRPVRRSAKRGARPDAASAAKPKAGSAAAGTAKARTPRATAKPKATATAKSAPKATARGPRPARGATAGADRGAARAPRPRRTIPPAGYAAPTSHADENHQSASADLIGTAVQAAGELAQIGFAVGRQTLQSMIDRLPKP